MTVKFVRVARKELFEHLFNIFGVFEKREPVKKVTQSDSICKKKIRLQEIFRLSIKKRTRWWRKPRETKPVTNHELGKHSSALSGLFSCHKTLMEGEIPPGSHCRPRVFLYLQSVLYGSDQFMENCRYCRPPADQFSRGPRVHLNF